MRRFAVVWGLCLLGTARLAFAQEAASEQKAEAGSDTEVSRLRKVIMDEQQVIADCMKRIDKLEASKTTQDKNGLSNFKITGDFRYRYEYIHQNPENNMLQGLLGPLLPPDDPSTRQRQRLRLRLGMEWMANDEWTVGAQLATTENGDPVSTNQTIGGSFAKKNIWLDLAYADYHPLAVPGLHLFAGKMKNPFYAPGKTEMIWDTDLTPEGMAATYAYKDFQPWEFAASTGYFQVQERPLDHDGQMFGIQGTARYNLTEDGKASVLAGVSYYDYINTRNYPTYFNTTGSHNALSLAVLNTPNNGFYADDFNLVDAFAEATFPVYGVPVGVFGEYVINTGADDTFFDSSKGDSAWDVGLTVGKCVTPHSWAARYEYRDEGRNAVMGAFSDSDFGGGGTNARGHILSAEYMLFKNVRLATKYFINDTKGNDWLRLLLPSESVNGPYQRFQMDINVKF